MILSEKAASFGATSCSTFWNAGSERLLDQTEKRLEARSSVRLDFSMAAMVLSNVGTAASAPMRSAFASASSMAVSRPGPNWSTFTWSKGGTPPNGPLQVEMTGFTGPDSGTG